MCVCVHCLSPYTALPQDLDESASADICVSTQLLSLPGRIQALTLSQQSHSPNPFGEREGGWKKQRWDAARACRSWSSALFLFLFLFLLALFPNPAYYRCIPTLIVTDSMGR